MFSDSSPFFYKAAAFGDLHQKRAEDLVVFDFDTSDRRKTTK